MEDACGTMTTRGQNHQTLETILRGYRLTQMVHVVAKLHVADHLAIQPRTAEELALAVGANAGTLFRLLRALAGEGLFRQDTEGRFHLAEEGHRLRSDVANSVHLRAIAYGEPWWWQAWGTLFEAVRTGATAFETVHHVDLYSYLASEPEAAEFFNRIMHGMTAGQAAAVATRYNFSEARKLVDIGGGHGALVTAILNSNPRITAVLFDRPSVIEEARVRLAQLNIVDRLTFASGNFFASVPGGADTYILKSIIHNWDDEKARLILRNTRRSMEENARLLLIERVIAAGNAPSPGKLADISMLVLTGGRERTKEEYGILLSSAGLVMRRVTPVDSDISVIEAEPA